MYYIIVLGILLLDQFTKWTVVNNMYLYQSIPLLDGFLHLTYVQNTGVAFSMLRGYNSLIVGVTALLMVILLAALVIACKKDKSHWSFKMSLAWIAGGGIGNILDRIFRGYVVDFIDFKIWPPVFNGADIFICCGCALMLVYVIFWDKDNKHDTIGN